MQANIDRDTLKFAFKASNITINGEDKPIAKDPITDPGKRSKRGRPWLIKTSEGYETVDLSALAENDMAQNNAMHKAYQDGDVFNLESLDVIRDRVRNS